MLTFTHHSSSSKHRAPCSPPGERLDLLLAFLVAALAFLLASFPTRNSDVWLHLARGRLLAQGTLPSRMGSDLDFDLFGNQTWLYDLFCYGCYAVLGGTGLVLGKALVAASIAMLLLRTSRFECGWCMSAICTSLALLAISPYLLHQPATVSYLFLALFLALLPAAPVRERFSLRSLTVAALFVVWANVDRWFVLGLGVAALVGLGEAVDAAFAGAASPNRWPVILIRRSFALVVLTAACLLNPSTVHAFALAKELAQLGSSGASLSPFERAYFVKIGWSPAGLAYFLLLGLSLLSFVAALPHWRWRRFLPWLGLVLLSALQARAVPFFAIVAGPVLASNIGDALSRLRLRAGSTGVGLAPSPTLPAGKQAALTAVVLLLLVVCAWPGWLQGPPFGPRRWAFDLPPSLERGALAVRRWHEEGKLGANSGGLHLSAESVYAFAWFCPTEKRLRLTAQGSAAQWRERMRSAGIHYVLVYDTDRDRLSMTLGGLVVDAEQWPLLYQQGDLAIFGWRDPDQPRSADRFRGWQLDLERLAFHPTEDKKAPPEAPDPQSAVRSWWDTFWKVVPLRSIDRDEALFHLLHAEALQRAAPLRHLSHWENSQAVGLIGAAGAWAPPSALCDAYFRLLLFRPPLPEVGSSSSRLSPQDRMFLSLQRRYVLQRDDAPPALYYLAVRAARRAVAANPEDASAHLLLGESYLGLLHATRERAWSGQLRQLAQLRQAQASAALNRALTLRPDFLQAHLHLGRLYQEMGYLDLALEHLQTYSRLEHQAGPSHGISREEYQARQAHNEQEVERLARQVQKRDNIFTLGSADLPTRERALLAFRNGLAAKALELLLESHLSAFGVEGMELELELLLGVGRARDVQQWLHPEHENDLGAASYHWFHARAAAARGDFVDAQEECAEAARAPAPSPDGPQPLPLRQRMAGEIATFLLNEQIPREASFAGLLPRLNQAVLIVQLQSQAQLLRQQAELSVLRGLLALEEGESEEAELAFRAALALWKDEAAAASGGGLDFNGRKIAQSCLRWLQ